MRRDGFSGPPRRNCYRLLKRVSLCVFNVGLSVTPVVGGATIAGQPVQPGGKAEIRFPISNYYQEYAAQGGNPRCATGRAVLTFPPGFDPQSAWPILIVTSTTDRDRTNPMDAEWYHPPANAEGWMILASDATIKPNHDSTPWRIGMLGAALDALHREWPQSARWPVVFAGMSGGAKRSGVLGAMLAKAGKVRICGFFLAGINDDRLSPAYHDYQPGPDFLNIPIWISGGMDDLIASPSREGALEVSLRRTGFKQVRVEHFMGEHWLKRSEVRLALRWFRELGHF